MTDLLTIDDALARILERVSPLPAETVAVEQAAGRVLAEDARAATDLPPFRSSAMDGFAVRAEDTPGTLPVTFRIAAGRPATRALEPGEAMGISTGGVVPDGADAVAPIEVVVQSANAIVLEEPVEPGAHVRDVAGDVRAGDTVLTAGLVLSAARIGALAAAGVASVRCSRPPRAAVLSTGTELRPPGEALGPGQIYEANSVMLGAALAGAGAEVERLEPVADDPDAHRAALAQGLTADVLVSSGGVSVGPHDLVRSVGAELGVQEVFWRVAVKPGKPVAFGVRDRTLVFGLPGNPVSALVGFELFVRPALRALRGEAEPGPRFEAGRLAEPLRRIATRDQLVRARSRLDAGETVLVPLRGQESHMIVRAAAADALVYVPRGDGELAAGAPARFLRV
ncbi:MAG TPA: gephyrin-like molybdotransferase Glp [Gaiellaceae bacterium]|nr:gephyrin-like molybdotransferase Glp [Gaiellaceae bacterium]